MRQTLHRIEVTTAGKGLFEITPQVATWVAEQRPSVGLLTLFCRHTSASLLIQENADPDVQTDLEGAFEGFAPEGPGRYVHMAEGPDDMPAHIRSALTQTQLAIPIDGGRLCLGRWQGIYLFEHRRTPHRRQIVLHLIAD
jgi:secondary thiamine-phosphate synthase enzyme